MTERTVTLINAIPARVSFILLSNKDLKKLAINESAPDGYIGVLDPLVTRNYIDLGDMIRPVDKIEAGQIPYEFPSHFLVYMKV
jgi:hypothetical protein